MSESGGSVLRPILLSGVDGWQIIGPSGRSREEEEWLAANAARVTLRDPSGRRWLRVDPRSPEHAELIADGWIP